MNTIDKRRDLEIMRDSLLQQLEESLSVIEDELKIDKEECIELNKMRKVAALIDIIEYILDRKYQSPF